MHFFSGSFFWDMDHNLLMKLKHIYICYKNTLERRNKIDASYFRRFLLFINVYGSLSFSILILILCCSSFFSMRVLILLDILNSKRWYQFYSVTLVYHLTRGARYYSQFSIKCGKSSNVICIAGWEGLRAPGLRHTMYWAGYRTHCQPTWRDEVPKEIHTSALPCSEGLSVTLLLPLPDKRSRKELPLADTFLVLLQLIKNYE